MRGRRSCWALVTVLAACGAAAWKPETGRKPDGYSGFFRGFDAAFGTASPSVHAWRRGSLQRGLTVWTQQRSAFIVPERNSAVGIESLNHELYGGIYAQVRTLLPAAPSCGARLAIEPAPTSLGRSCASWCLARASRSGSSITA